MSFPRISFGIIVLNGEPFTRYCLRALYPFADEMIVVEGAAPGAAGVATPDGHSTDGTLEVLRRFKAEEDPENKLQIVVRDGFWSEKDEMSQAYAERATGDYVWQVDVDEFYKAEDMEAILTMLRDDPSITAMSFKMITFWGGFDYICDGWILRRGEGIYHRLFKWGAGYKYVTHRPPTVIDASERNLRTIKWIKGEQLARQGLIMYHYSLLFPSQVREKSDYYEQGVGRGYSGGQRWLSESYLQLKRPFRVHNVFVYPSWLERFHRTHPVQVQMMRAAIRNGEIQVELRPTDDIEHLLNSPRYSIQRTLVKYADYLDRFWRYIKGLVKTVLQRGSLSREL